VEWRGFMIHAATPILSQNFFLPTQGLMMRIYQLYGFSFIEVLVSLLLLSMLLLGADALEIYALRAHRVNDYFSVASLQIQNIAERLKVHQAFVSTSTVEMEWNQQNQLVLPGGRGVIEGVFPHYKISIFWGELSETHCQKNQLGQSGCIQQMISL